MKNPLKQEIIIICKLLRLDQQCNILPKDSLKTTKKKFLNNMSRDDWRFAYLCEPLSKRFCKEFRSEINKIHYTKYLVK